MKVKSLGIARTAGAVELGMRIGELARATGTSERLLRYYEERGLLAPTRLANGYRDYPDGTVEEVARIRRLLDAGLPVRVIKEVVDCFCDGSGDVEPCLAPVLEAELQALDRKIQDLHGRRDDLASIVGRISSLRSPA